MQLEVKEIADSQMPEGHQWAVVTVEGEVWLLVRGSNAVAHVDTRPLNQALAQAG